MKEIFRIANKKRILFIVTLLLINVIFLIKENINSKEYCQEYDEIVAVYEKMPVQDASSELEQKINEVYEQLSGEIGSEKVKQKVSYVTKLQRIRENIDYIINYETKYERLIERTQQLVSLGMISKENEFVYNNARNTLLDFAGIREIELDLVNPEQVNRFFDFNMTGYLLLVIMVVIVISFFDEQKKGLFSLIRSTKGRNKLVFCRQAIILTISFSLSFIFYGINYLILGYICGFTDWNTPIQSFERFADAYILVNIGQYFILYWILTAVVLAVIANIVWAFLNLFNNVNLSLIMLALSFVIEYILWKNIGDDSEFALLKYANIFQYLNIGQVYEKYLNIRVFGSCIEIMDVTVIATIMTLALSALVAIILAVNKRAFHSRIGRVFKCDIGSHTSILMHEMHRYLFSNKILIILVVFGIFTYLSMDFEEPYLGVERNLQLQYVDELEGHLDEYSREYIASERNALEQQIEEFNNYVDDNPDYVMDPGYNTSIGVFETKDRVLTWLEEEEDRLLTCQSKGYNVGFVNPMGYEQLFKISDVSNYTYYLMAILVVVLSCSTLFSADKDAGIGSYHKSLMYGRERLLGIRYIITIVTVLLVWLTQCIAELYKIQNAYGLEQLKLGMQSLEMFDNAVWNISIGQMMLILYSIRFVTLLCVSLLTVCISNTATSKITGGAFCALILVLPSVFVAIGVDLFKYISFVNIYKCFDLLYEITCNKIVCFLPLIIVVIIAVVSVILVKKNRTEAI